MPWWPIRFIVPTDTYLNSFSNPVTSGLAAMGKYSWHRFDGVSDWDAKCSDFRSIIWGAVPCRTKYHFRVIPSWFLNIIFP